MTVRLDSVIEQVELLPPLPGTAVRLMEAITDSQARIDQIIEIIQYDQNLTSQVLRLCNSAFFSLSRRIGSLRDALAYLGSRQLMQLVLGVHCNAILQKAQPGYGLMVGMLWQHSSAVALASERLGKEIQPDSPETLFTAGLLHDIGKVILGKFLADDYQRVTDLLDESPITFHEAEREVLGYSHTEVGELLTRRWQLPEQIVAATRYHHEPASYSGGDAEARTTVDLVHLADSLALTMGVGVGNDGLLYSIDPGLIREYHLDERTLDQIRAEVLTELQDLEKIYKGTGASK